jgi:hypothetical protein
VSLARQARAFVATGNDASLRAFARVGFQVQQGICELLIYRTEGLSPYLWSTPGVTIRAADNISDAADWLPHLPEPGDSPGLRLLLAEQDGQPAGYAEMIEVQTLLYRGVWIESLVAPLRGARESLIHEAVNWAVGAGLNEIGAMVPEHDWLLRDALLARGFRSLDRFHRLMADLPLPGLAAHPHPNRTPDRG